MLPGGKNQGGIIPPPFERWVAKTSFPQRMIFPIEPQRLKQITSGSELNGITKDVLMVICL